MQHTILDTINSPQDIKGLDMEGLRQLCAEVRDYMVACCAVNPGHLGSSLGAVELIVAMHYVYDTPKDKLVFDVGHQAYAHKILTGRREAFKSNRTREGISGFPKMDESPYDAFGAGHSSTAISAALGLAEAARLQGRQEKVVALVGDGAMTGGLSFEGLNNAGGSKADVLILLNDNDQSIDRNLGALHNYLLKLTTGSTYNRLKASVWNRLGQTKLRDTIQKMTKDTKSNLVRKSGGALFEALGFRYFGPIDGNDIEQVVFALQRLKNLRGPRVLQGDRFQDVFGQTLLDLARADSRVVGITPAMASGCGMTLLAREMPDRFYDVGIEEEHAATFSAGLAAGGMRPYCNIYSSFSQRAYDQIIHDVALQHLPVVFCFDRSGLVGEDGATHHGCFDLAAYRSIPGITIAIPKNEKELRDMMHQALVTEGGPWIIRYPRGNGEGTPWRDQPFSPIPAGKAECLAEGEQLAVLAAGPFACRAVEAAEILKKETGVSPIIYNIRYLKPLDEEALRAAASCRAVVTIEDGALKGGLYGAVAEYMAGLDRPVPVHGIGIPDRFIAQDTQAAQRAECGLDTAGILDVLRRVVKKD